MRIRLFIAAIFVLLLIPFAANAVSQETIDQYIFLLQQPEFDDWGDGTFDDQDLLDGLDIIYQQAVQDEDDIMVRRVIYAMGETGLVGFIPDITEALETEPVVACYALGKIASDDSVYALIGMLDNEDMQVRDAAVWGLGNMPYTDSMEDAKDDAVEALDGRLDVEEEDWILEDIQAAVVLIETGVITDESFEEPQEHL
jgi:HEAT repeat protein